MGKLTDLDRRADRPAFMLSSDTDDSQFLRGLTITQSQLARLFNVTKQAVHVWVRDGKIKINPDGKIDPNQALSQLLTGSDPSRLRCALLKPVRDEIDRITAENRLLQARLDTALNDVEFYESCSNETSNVLTALERKLANEWDILHGVEGRYALGAISDWIEAASMNQDSIQKNLSDYLQAPPPARCVEEKGGGVANNFNKEDQHHV